MRPKEKPPTCEGCPARDWGVGFVPPEGPLDAKLCLIGQGPGEMEARFSRPFLPTAPSGREVERWLHLAGYQRTDTLVTNVIWCWLPRGRNNQLPEGNREPTPAELAHCTRAHLIPLLKEADLLQPCDDRVIVTIGTPATNFIRDIDSGTDKYIGNFDQRDLRALGD